MPVNGGVRGIARGRAGALVLSGAGDAAPGDPRAASGLAIASSRLLPPLAGKGSQKRPAQCRMRGAGRGRAANGDVATGAHRGVMTHVNRGRRPAPRAGSKGRGHRQAGHHGRCDGLPSASCRRLPLDPRKMGRVAEHGRRQAWPLKDVCGLDTPQFQKHRHVRSVARGACGKRWFERLAWPTASRTGRAVRLSTPRLGGMRARPSEVEAGGTARPGWG